MALLPMTAAVLFGMYRDVRHRAEWWKVALTYGTLGDGWSLWPVWAWRLLIAAALLWGCAVVRGRPRLVRTAISRPAPGARDVA